MGDSRSQIINYIIEDLEKLNCTGLTKVYKFIRMELIAGLSIDEGIKKQLKDLAEYESAELIGVTFCNDSEESHKEITGSPLPSEPVIIKNQEDSTND